MNQKCKTFSRCVKDSDTDYEINTWLELLGPTWSVSHVAMNEYRIIVFVTRTRVET